MHRMHAVHGLDQRCANLLIGCGDGGRRRPQCPVDMLGIPAREQNMLEVGCPELREYWGSSGEQSFCISNAMECWVCELKLPLEMGVLSVVQNVDKELRNGGKASTCGIHAGI